MEIGTSSLGTQGRERGGNLEELAEEFMFGCTGSE